MTTIINSIKNISFIKRLSFVAMICVLSLSGCQDDYEAEISKGELIQLSASSSEMVLTQAESFNTAITFNWTTGSNQGTGASISYVLEMDKAGNNFASPKVYDFGKQVYDKSVSVEDLNDMANELWSVEYGQSVDMEARVTAKIADETVADDVSSVVSFSVQTFKPVTETLYIVGSATPAGWNISEAIEMVPDNEKPWVFVYEGQLTRVILSFL